MLSINDVIDFLLVLLRDTEARAAFEQDPEGTLARAGLDGVTGQDVRDAQLLLTDSGAAAPDGPGPAHHGEADPVREITHITQNYHAAPEPPAQIVTTIDDRDTFFINDSFNSDDDVTIIDDSFNEVAVDNSQDNDVTNVENDTIAIQDNDVTNVENDTIAIQDNDITTIDDVIAVDNSEDNDVVTEIAEPEADPEPVVDPDPGLGQEPDPEPVSEPDAGAELAVG
ncbi:MAG: IniB N-terminal domain-containing protein [Pseudonocardia sp.]|nr:IniB N-terminal domain-containing protein [Pseudonocardia sp.]